MQHPDWNIAKGHHSDVEFKPAIARYDWDQTYDVMEFVHLPYGFNLVFNIPCSELMAVDRFTPYKYRWAEGYSDYLYDFCKAFNFSPHADLSEKVLKDESSQWHINQTVLDAIPEYKVLETTPPTPPPNVLDIGWIRQTFALFNQDLNNYRRVTQVTVNPAPQPPTIVTESLFKGVWNSITTYQRNDIVRRIDKVFIATTNNTDREPNDDATEWKELSITVPEFTYVGDVYNKNLAYNVTFPKGDYQITMMIDNNYQEGLDGNIRTLNQAFFSFSITQQQVDNAENVRDINLIIKSFTELDETLRADNQTTNAQYYGDYPFNFCANSIVISHLVVVTPARPATATTPYVPAVTQWQEFTVPDSPFPKFLLYKDIAEYFTSVKTQLITYCATTYRTIGGLKVIVPVQSYLSKAFPVANWWVDIYNKTNYRFGSYVDRWLKPEYIDTEVSAFPSYLTDYHYLQRANNDKWKHGSALNDLGYAVTPNKFPVGLYNEFLPTNLYNIYADLYTLPEDRHDLGYYNATYQGWVKHGHTTLPPNALPDYDYIYGDYGIDIPNWSIYNDQLFNFFNTNSLYNGLTITAVWWSTDPNVIRTDNPRERPIALLETRTIPPRSHGYFNVSNWATIYSVRKNIIDRDAIIFQVYSYGTPYGSEISRGFMTVDLQNNAVKSINQEFAIYQEEVTTFDSAQINPYDPDFTVDDIAYTEIIAWTSIGNYKYAPTNMQNATDIVLTYKGSYYREVQAVHRDGWGAWFWDGETIVETDTRQLYDVDQHTYDTTFDLWTQAEWQQLTKHYQVTDEEYLTYLQALKLAYEEASKTW